MYYWSEHSEKVSDCDTPKCDREELRSKLQSLVYAASEAEYVRLKSDIASLANDDFNEYFEKNWQNCKEMWVSYLRDQYLTMSPYLFFNRAQLQRGVY